MKKWGAVLKAGALVCALVLVTKASAQPNLTPYQPTGWSGAVAVGNSPGGTGASDDQFDQGLEGRMELFPGGGELGRDLRRTCFHDGEEQLALGAKALDKGCGDNAGFPGHVREGELYRAEALHGACGSGEDLLVGSFAGARRHYLKGRVA